MYDFSNHCFVCGLEVDSDSSRKHKQFNLPVCDDCFGTDREKLAVSNLLEGMADGFVCGCI